VPRRVLDLVLHADIADAATGQVLTTVDGHIDNVLDTHAAVALACPGRPLAIHLYNRARLPGEEVAS
jgi:hypothetical protein